MKKKINALIGTIRDPERDFQERLFILLTVIAIVAITLVLIGDLLIGENIIECAALLAILVVSPFITAYSVKNERVQLGAGIIAFGIVFMVLPVSFCFGGGLYGGANIWFAFSYLYIGLILIGRLRTVLMTLLTMMVFVLYGIDYFFPQFIVPHNRDMWFLDSIISVFLVGFVIYIMVWFENKLYRGENTRAQEQTREIEELNKAQNRFFSSMSHEIRTPINTIIGLNEMILREDISDEVAEDARNIRSASKILLSLINDILDMSKIESGKMDIVFAPYDVGQMLSEIVNMIWIRATEKGLHFSVDVDPELPVQLYSDEVRIKQILINLLNNAIKYTSEGNVSLSVSSDRSEPGSVLVTYSVEDTGMGIRKENIPHLFDAFKRVDEEKNRYIEGTGLGLSIVKQLTDLLGGEISVNSIYTKGSTFSVSIRQEIADGSSIGKFDPEDLHGAAERAHYHQSFEAPEARVLIVDDNSANLMVVTKLLRDTKVQTDTALSGAEALSLTLQNKYDCILMDHMMPEMDGIECLHAIREQSGGFCKDTPVIALTANAGSEEQILYRREGFDGYILKPVDPPVLEQTLIDMLPPDFVRLSDEDRQLAQSQRIVRESKARIPLVITTDSVCDLPRELIAKYQIAVLPYKIHIGDGVFLDGEETDGDAIVRYLEDKKTNVMSESPSVEDYEAFFSEHLTHAQSIIHIATGRKTSAGFANATEAALAFSNVRVVDSGHLSSGLGIMVLAAACEVDSGITDADAILKDLENLKEKIQTSFIVENTEYLYRGGRLSERIHRICSTLMVHPILSTKDSNMGVGGIILGSSERTRDVYIRRALSNPDEIDRSMLFITYVGMKCSDIEKIRDTVLAMVPFECVYLLKATPAVAINSGPGTFGLLFSRK